MATTATPPGMIDITIDGESVRVPAGTTVFDAARMNGVAIPTLCHLQNQTPVGVCRLCVVDTGARVLSASCVRPVEPGMKVVTNSEKVRVFLHKPIQCATPTAPISTNIEKDAFSRFPCLQDGSLDVGSRISGRIVRREVAWFETCRAALRIRCFNILPE